MFPRFGLSRILVLYLCPPNWLLNVSCETTEVDMGKLIGYTRVSTRQEDVDRQVSALVAAGVRRGDIYIGHGVSGGRASSSAV